MTDCKQCKEGENKDLLLYEDPNFKVFVPENAVSKGHVRVLPKKHLNAFEELSDEEAQTFFWLANMVASSLFDTMGAIGTNIIEEDQGHPVLDIYARFQDDGLNFQWEPKKGDPSELDSIASKISSKVGIVETKQEAPKEIEEPKPATIEEEEGKENYLLKSLDKLP